MGYYRNFDTPEFNNPNNRKGKIRRKIVAFVACFFISCMLWLIIAMDKKYSARINFTILSDQKTKIKVTARIYGEGFDILKEKFSSNTINMQGFNSKSKIDTEQLIRDSLELNSNLNYTQFKPPTIELNN